jgi:hypothetical protein
MSWSIRQVFGRCSLDHIHSRVASGVLDENEGSSAQPEDYGPTRFAPPSPGHRHHGPCIAVLSDISSF